MDEDLLEEKFTKGEQYMRKSQWELGLSVFEQILQVDASNIEALNCLAICMQSLKQEGVKDVYQKALAIDPKDSFTLFNLGTYYFSVRKFDKALKNFNKSNLLEPNNERTLFNIGACLDELGDYVSSTDVYKELVQRTPTNQKALTNLAISLDRQGKNDEAKTYFLHALKLGEDARIHNNYGICLKKLGDHNGALKQYKKACKLNPKYSLAHYNLAVHLSDMSNFNRAIKSYQRALETDPSNIFAKLGIGNIHELLGDLKQSLGIYTELLTDFPTLGGISEKVDNIREKITKQEAKSREEQLKEEMRQLIEEYENYKNWDMDTCKKFLSKDGNDPR